MKRNHSPPVRPNSPTRKPSAPISISANVNIRATHKGRRDSYDSEDHDSSDDLFDSTYVETPYESNRRGFMTGSGDEDEYDDSSEKPAVVSSSVPDDFILSIKPLNLAMLKSPMATSPSPISPLAEPNTPSIKANWISEDLPFIDGKPQLKLALGSVSFPSISDLDSPTTKTEFQKFRVKIPASPTGRSTDFEEEPRVHVAHPQAPDFESETRALAKKLGETYVSADLTTLLQLKEAFQDRLKERKEREKSHSRLLSRESRWLLGMDNRVNNPIAERPISSIKCDILRVFAAITETSYNMKGVGPINLMFSELLAIQTQKSYQREKEPLETLIHQVIANIAVHAEIQHSFHWDNLTKEMPYNLRLSFRQKLDKLLWRVHVRILSACQSGDLQEIATQLTILGSYVNSSKSKIMASQAVSVCMKSILSIKGYIFSLPNISTNSFETLPIIHSLLGIFNAIVDQTNFEPLHDLFLKILIFKGETWAFV